MNPHQNDDAAIQFLGPDPPVSVPSPPATGATDDAAPWVLDDQDRYSRLRLISWWRQERLASAKVLVVGAGALGNEVLKNLALLGVGTTYLIDKDTIDLSNLSRSVLFRADDDGQPKARVAAARMRELNPDVRVVAWHGDVLTDLGLGLFASVDLVIGCLDNREARLWINRQCWKVNTPWIDAGIQEIQGVVKVFVPPDNPCYECGMTARDYQLLNLRYSCPLLPREDLLQGKVPTAPTIASMMGALQVQEALKLLHGLPVSAGSVHVFNGVTNQFYTTRLPWNPDCLSHETYPPPIGLELGHHATLGALFEAVSAEGHDGPHTLILDRDLVVAWNCPSCAERSMVLRPLSQVRQADAACPTCGRERLAERAHFVDDQPPWLDLPLAQLGIPPWDIVRVDGQGGATTQFFRLDGDKDLAVLDVNGKR